MPEMSDQPNSAYFRELQGYSLSEIMESLQCSEEESRNFIKLLRQYGIVKIVRKEKKDFSDITNEDILPVEDAEDVDGCYKFDFVGVIVLGIQKSEDKGLEKVLFCYPKYMKDYDGDSFKKVLRAIQEYGKKNEELVHLYNGSDKGAFNHLALALHILNDYYENGIYSNTEQVIETNGEGEIDWDRTINETFAYLKDNRPYYLELKTIATQNDEYDYFKRLHECIVTECSNYLDKIGLLDLFGLNSVQLSESSLDDFGDRDYIKYRLEREIASQFVTKKQNLLKTLYTYVAEKSTEKQFDNYSVYGTSCLNLVWEKACGEIFDNHFKDGWYRNKRVNYQLAKPKWKIYDSLESKSFENEKETLIPDIVTMSQVDDRETLCILDGKYYFVDCKDGKINGNPGIQDVVKQFVYHKAFLKLVEECNYPDVFNAFLFPMETENSKPTDSRKNIDICGEVTFLEWGVESLVPIHLAFVFPDFVWKNYVKGFVCSNELSKAIKEFLLSRSASSRYLSFIPYVPTLARAAESPAIYDASISLSRESTNRTVVGYLKSDYLNQILTNKANKILFYFYRKRHGFIYPLHPDVAKCVKFVGYGDDGQMVQGDVCKEMKICKPEQLKKLLESIGLPRSTGFNADEYYVIEIENVGVYSEKSLQQLKEDIAKYDGNDITHEYSPKVIESVS